MTPTTTGNGGRTLIKWIFLGLMLVIVISYGSCQYTRAKKEVEAGLEFAEQSPLPEGPEVLEGVYAESAGSY